MTVRVCCKNARLEPIDCVGRSDADMKEEDGAEERRSEEKEDRSELVLALDGDAEAIELAIRDVEAQQGGVADVEGTRAERCLGSDLVNALVLDRSRGMVAVVLAGQMPAKLRARRAQIPGGPSDDMIVAVVPRCASSCFRASEVVRTLTTYNATDVYCK